MYIVHIVHSHIIQSTHSISIKSDCLYNCIYIDMCCNIMYYTPLSAVSINPLGLYAIAVNVRMAKYMAFLGGKGIFFPSERWRFFFFFSFFLLCEYSNFLCIHIQYIYTQRLFAISLRVCDICVYCGSVCINNKQYTIRHTPYDNSKISRRQKHYKKVVDF